MNSSGGGMVMVPASAAGSAPGSADPEYDFVPPPETIVFEPTKEEFKDALAYIEKIRPVAEEYGIVRIKPPEDWQPPFAVDVDKLRFTPRIQRLNELEAHTRIKLNFLDQVAKFWELQGSTLKIPLVERRALDLYTLKRYVHKEGGMEVVNLEKKWTKVANDMGYSNANKNIGGLLKAHYERILYPLDIFEREEQKKLLSVKEEDSESCANTKEEPEDEKEYKPHNIPSRMGMKPPADKDKAGRRSQRYAGSDSSSPVKLEAGESPTECSQPETKNGVVGSNNIMAVASAGPTNSFSKELQRLQFFGAGPKMAGLPSEKNVKEKTRGVKINFEYDPLAKYICQTCGKGDAEEQMLLCDGCDDSYHTFCLMPPLAEIPKGDWRCPKCVAAEVSKPLEAFGFEQATKQYTLQTFGEMADQFKSDYFNMPVHLIPTSLVEKEYWRILGNIDEDVVVEYGADLHTMDHGSGFPTLTSKNLSKEDEAYAKSDWNLNRLPVAHNSILRCIDMDISGMKVPWLYVGMCFSTFCWHTEDHWTPSINYLHWGEPKTWYGIPGRCAEKAEEVMRNSAKELFSSQPDLLHHIVTTVNPNVLQSHGIPVYRTDQHAGEFIITFPRSYHAGFNQGYNLAEAVNYAPPGWLEMGRKCVEHYSWMRRLCVFCHDELVCMMATQPEKLTLQIAAATYKDMLVMVEQEKKMRRLLLESGVTEAEREAFELLPDDERQCAICKTTCFLSALASLENKDSDEIVCLRHFKSMECEPDKLILRYRYTLDELAALLEGLRQRAESYDKWVDKVKESLEAKGDDRLEFSDLKKLHDEAAEAKYPDTELSLTLTLTVEEAEKCQTVVSQLGNKKVRTRTRGVVDAKYRLTVEELELFVNQLETLPVKVAGHEVVEDLLKQVEEFKKDARKMLDLDLEQAAKSEDSEAGKDIEKCLERGLGLDVELEELSELKSRQKQLKWLESVYDLLDDDDDDDDDSGGESSGPTEKGTFEALKEIMETGTDLAAHPAIERSLGRISGLITEVDDWEEKAKKCLAAKPRYTLGEVERLVREGTKIARWLPSLSSLRDAARKAKDWLAKAEVMKNPDNFPYLETMEALVARGRNLPVRLDSLANLETQVAHARAWRERAARVFLKKNSQMSLLEALAPRIDATGQEAAKKRKKQSGSKDDHHHTGGASGSVVNVPHPIYQSLSAKDIANAQLVVKAFKDAEIKELQAIKDQRAKKRNQKDQQQDQQKDAAPASGSAAGPSSSSSASTTSSTQFECELCFDLFQPSHVPLPKTQGGSASPPAGSDANNSSHESVPPASLRDIKFLCPTCLRTRRPRLETILSLLVSLNKLPVRLPEGEALQCLTERAMAWRDRAQKALDSTDVSEALKKLSDHSAASASHFGKKHAAEASASSDHHQQKPPEVKLTGKSSSLLENLMVEGDLLEVSMDEVLHIWRVLQATEPRRSKRYPNLNQLEADLLSAREEKIKAKKRKNLEALSSPGNSGYDTDDHGVSAGKSAAKKTVSSASRSGSNNNNGSSSNGGSNNNSKNKRKRRESSDQEEEQEDCSAYPKCLRPTGKEVHWVQCDGCQLWFHLHCIGLKPEQVSEDEDFMCKGCKPTHTTKISSAGNNRKRKGGGGGGD